jgi:hypothetical protein
MEKAISVCRFECHRNGYSKAKMTYIALDQKCTLMTKGGIEQKYWLKVEHFALTSF